MCRKAKSLILALGMLLVLGGTTAARAADWRECRRRIAHEQRDLDRAVARHGYFSRQAWNERRALDRLYAECRYRDR
jgi:hypothetical protein